ncbi:MAG: hypothetical protein JSW71_09505 [Gemmatimonadota bacterium]|nr:MAG: hypothetical protein JSW71_09505 [Gemmatimonadota bacterium]
MSARIRWTARCAALGSVLLSLAAMVDSAAAQSWIPPNKRQPTPALTRLQSIQPRNPLLQRYLESAQRRWASSGPLVPRAPLATISESEPNDTLSEANLVSLGDTLNGVITPVGDVDYFAIDLTAGVMVDFDVDASELGSPIDPVIVLLDVDSATVLAWNDDAGSLDSRIVYPVPADGRYFVGIADLGLRGGFDYTYTFKFGWTELTEQEPNNTPADANSLALGDTVSGTIHSPTDFDYWVFDVPGPLLVESAVETWQVGSSLAPELVFYDTDGVTVLAQIDAAAGEPRIRHMIETPGRYFVRIAAIWETGGLYALSVEGLEPGPGDPTTLFAAGIGVPLRMAAAETGDLYVIDDMQARIVKVSANGTVSLFALGFGYPHDLEFGGNGELLVSGWDDQTGLATIWSFTELGERFTLVSETEADLQAITVGPDGAIWVAACGMICPTIRKYGPAGDLEEEFDLSNAEWPTYLAFSPAGELHYTTSFNAVYKLVEGTPQRVVQDQEYLEGLAFDEDGYIYVANGWRGLILLFDPQYNKVEDPFAFSNLSGPIDLVFGRDATGAMTSRLFAATPGWGPPIDPQYAGGIAEMNPAGIRAPGWRIGTDLLRIARTSLDTAVVGAAYADTLHLESASEPVTWSVIADSLPPRITLGASNGTLAGVPEVAGEFNFGIMAESGGEFGFARFTLSVREPQLTTDDAVEAILGAPGLLTPELEAFLDLQGNRNGTFDVGDVRAFLWAKGVLLEQAAQATTAIELVRKVPNETR